MRIAFLRSLRIRLTFWYVLLLAGMGLLQMGMTSQPLRMVIGLLTFLAGSEIIYSALENSVLVAGLLAAIDLSLALIGAYLMAAPSMKDNP